MNVTLVRFILRMDEPGGVMIPAPVQRHEPDLVADRDPWDRPQIPGASLAGALRELVRGYLPADDGTDTSDRLFGRLLPSGSATATVDSEASSIWVLGGRLLDGHEAGADTVAGLIRAATAIDRHRGAARAHSLRLEELLPAGTRFEVFLRWDDADADDLNLFLTHLMAWQPMIGHGVSRGRGRCAVETVRYGSLDLARPDDLLRWVTGSGPKLIREVAAQPAVPLPGQGSIGNGEPLATISVSIVGPLRIGSGRVSERTAGTDGPRVSLIVDEGGPLVPGSTLKGLFRSRMEYILRSVAGRDAACQNQSCGRCWPCGVLGYAGGSDPARSSVGVRGRLRFTDARVTNGIPATRTHVAIDRFTGGAGRLSRDPATAVQRAPDPGDEPAETGRGLLFTVQTLEHGGFTVVIEDLGLDSEEREDARALLRLVLQDLQDGLVGVGGGMARGYGSITVDIAEVESTGDLPTLAESQRQLAQIASRTRTEG